LFLLLLGVLAMAVPMAALADEEQMMNGLPEYRSFVTKAGKLRTSGTVDPDTVWIGHIGDPTWRPRDKNGNIMDAVTYPTIATGGFGPYHIGRGPNFPGIGPGATYNGVWDFDHFQPGETDSLMGWWPLARAFQSGDAVNNDDKARPFYGFDYGNLGNYVINQGTPKRTFGVVSYWHRDPGNLAAPAFTDTGAVIPGPNVEWKPIGGTGNSAWCGLRAPGDNNVIDPITGNAINGTVLSYRGNNSYNQVGSQSASGTDGNFPGYGSQWDQMLYQDITVTDSTNVVLGFDYVTAMDVRRGGLAQQRIGYFYKDPKKIVAPNDGNFISATDAEASQQGPVDSFMVYVGRPVDDLNCRYTDGNIAPVYDKNRRWFSEVVRLDNSGGLGNVLEVLTATGFKGGTGAGGVLLPVAFSSGKIGPTLVARNIITATGGTFRVVFRVKTNRGNDDEDFGDGKTLGSKFSSLTRGAAVIDNVSLTQGGGANLVKFGDFENASSIDNNLGTATTAAWKTTGKPPGVYVHVHTTNPATIGAAPWNDPCSPPDLADPASTSRQCNMVNNVLTGGDHDNAEKPGGEFGAPDQDRQRWVASPTINLVSFGGNNDRILNPTSGPGVGQYNAMGIDEEIAVYSDINVFWDVHTPGFRGNAPGNGNFFSVGLQSYPARQANGLKVWGETRHLLTINFYAQQSCFQNASSPFGNGLLLTSNAGGVPDSIRIYMQYMSRCFTFPPSTNLTCSPNSGVFTGNHFDNLSIALIDAPPPPGLAASPWYKYSDAFPATNVATFTSSVFDTCAAWLKAGFNAYTATPGLSRPDVQADSAWVDAAITPGLRVDMIFRILPGVGNYVQIGNRNSGIRRIPTSTAAALPADGTLPNGLTPTQRFWGAYMQDNGAFGTGGNGTTGPGHTGGVWDPNKWNSARCDTVEKNLFPCSNLGSNVSGLALTSWHTMYHESDPKYSVLGIAKNRCFVVDPSVGRGLTCNSKTTTSVTSCNVICGTHPVSPGGFPPLWTSDLTSGLPATENGLPTGQTYEFTKIIPDGLLTPGAHVQYFFRRTPGLSAAVDLLPDTNFVFNTLSDGARWWHFSVLPDRWKDSGFGGSGMACMLVDDIGDRRFDEFFWVSIADSIGLTLSNKRGAHNGWRARGDQDITVNIGGDDTIARRDNGGQPGTRYDLWNTTAGESQTTAAAWLSNRAAAQPVVGELVDGKATRTGPTGDMLRNFYRNLVYLAGDLTTTFFGRIANRTDDDLAMLNDFAVNAAGTTKPRSVVVYGSGFSEWMTGQGFSGFLGSYFGTTLRNGVYRTFSTNAHAVPPFVPVAGSALDNAGGGFGLNGMKFAMSDACGLENDVLQVNGVVATAVAQVQYENVGSNGPYVASIYAPNGTGRDQITFIDGTRIQRIGTSISHDPVTGAEVLPLSQAGARAYLFKAITILGTLDCGSLSAPVAVGDGPMPGSAFVNFLNLRSSNPMHSGQARIAFGLARTEKVQVRVYDVTGRLVKTVADRVFAAGQEHVVMWDGTSDGGVKVKSGVYFYQLKTPTWTSQRKLAVLAN
jgi:hypothetical protein